MAADELDEAIRELCERKGLTKYAPWEIAPWDVYEGPSPWPPTVGGYTSWQRALALRRKLLAELEAADE